MGTSGPVDRAVCCGCQRLCGDLSVIEDLSKQKKEMKKELENKESNDIINGKREEHNQIRNI